MKERATISKLERDPMDSKDSYRDFFKSASRISSSLEKLSLDFPLPLVEDGLRELVPGNFMINTLAGEIVEARASSVGWGHE